MRKEHPSIKKLPDTPGVYFFLSASKEVLYVGKATSLKSRVKSYFSGNLIETRGIHILKMVEQSQKVEFRVTDSVLEALILEAKFIKELKPTYNTRDKDDKSFNYLVVTVGEAFPRFLTVRGKDLATTLGRLRIASTKKKEPVVYGPFPHAGQFKEALKILRKIFPYYDTARSVEELREKRDRKLLFNEAIGVYPEASVTSSEYARTVRYIMTMFDGKVKKLIRTLERDMKRFAKQQKFEQAVVVKRQLFSLQHIEDVSLIGKEKSTNNTEGYRIEGYDVAHLMGSDAVGVMTVVADGVIQKKEYRTFSIRSSKKGSDTHALREVLERRLAHPEWRYPRLIVVDGGRAQINVAKKVLAESGIQIPIVAVTKNARHKPSALQGPIKIKNRYQNEILLVNAEAHRFSLAVHKKKRAKRVRS